MNLGIFGGSFSPVHLGHYQIVRQILALGQVDRILVVPAYQSPFKLDQEPLDSELRLSMLRATFADLANAQIELYEMNRTEVSYTAHSLRHFSRAYPDDHLFLILGEDAFAHFPQWFEALEILKMARLLVFRRHLSSPPDLSQATQFAGDRVQWLDLDLPPVSSTKIRGGSLTDLVEQNWLHPEALKLWMSSHH
ncbi:MAG: nicotinate (nicotinamide) nucleotide adenylyltransferase [bacterium]|nr:nicotinate (nicotinamide) nucleotide adenylyltransferase [bacterium]